MPPFVSRRVNRHNRIVGAVCVKVNAVYALQVGIVHAVLAYETTDSRVIVAGLQIVKPRFFVIEIPTITEGIFMPYMLGVGYFIPLSVKHNMVAPRVVLVSYHNLAVIVKYGYYITLHVFTVETKAVFGRYKARRSLVVVGIGRFVRTAYKLASAVIYVFYIAFLYPSAK